MLSLPRQGVLTMEEKKIILKFDEEQFEEIKERLDSIEAALKFIGDMMPQGTV